MLRNIITPDSTTITIEIPLDYVGKDLELLLFALDEIKIDHDQPVHRQHVPETIKGTFSENGHPNPTTDDAHKHRDPFGRRLD